MASKKKGLTRHSLGGVSEFYVLQIETSSFEIFAGLSFAGAKPGEVEEFRHGQPRLGQLRERNRFGGHFANEFSKCAFSDAVEFAAKKDLAGADRLARGGVPMDQRSGAFRQAPVRRASAGIGHMFGFQSRYFGLGQKRKVFQITDHIAVTGLNPKLVKSIDTGACGIKPDGAGFRFSELGAICFGDERKRQAKSGLAEFLANQVDPGGDVAPLIRPADLEAAISLSGQFIKIEGLQKHVAKFGIADAYFPIFHSCSHGFFGNHLVHREVLADGAQKIEVTHRGGPLGVVDEDGWIG